MHNRMTDDFLANLAAKQSRSIYPTQQNKKRSERPKAGTSPIFRTISAGSMVDHCSSNTGFQVLSGLNLSNAAAITSVSGPRSFS